MHSAFVPFPEWLSALFFSDNHTAMAFLRGNLFFLSSMYFCSQKSLHLYVSMSRQRATNTYFSVPMYVLRTDGWAAGVVNFCNEKKKILQEPSPLFPCLSAVLVYLWGLCVWNTSFHWVCPLDFCLLKMWNPFPQSMRSDFICLFALCHQLSQTIFSLNSFCCCTIVINEMRGGKVPAGCLVFFLKYLHTNRQRFHKKNEGIILFGKQKCKQQRCAAYCPQEITRRNLRKTSAIFALWFSLIYFYCLLLCRDTSVHK